MASLDKMSEELMAVESAVLGITDATRVFTDRLDLIKPMHTRLVDTVMNFYSEWRGALAANDGSEERAERMRNAMNSLGMAYLFAIGSRAQLDAEASIGD